jgi:hypothetical protein
MVIMKIVKFVIFIFQVIEYTNGDEDTINFSTELQMWY